MQENPGNKKNPKKTRGPHLDKYMPYSFFCKRLLFFLQRVKVFSQWHSLDELHDYVQSVFYIKEN